MIVADETKRPAGSMTHHHEANAAQGPRRRAPPIVGGHQSQMGLRIKTRSEFIVQRDL